MFMRDVKLLKHLLIILLLGAQCNVLTAYAIDHVKMPKRRDGNDLQGNYVSSVLQAALVATVEKYGPYKLSRDFPSITQDRSVKELLEGERINTVVSTLHEKYYGSAISIPFPIRRGILSYRVALVHRENKRMFHTLNKADDLNKYTIGVFKELSTWSMMRELGYPLVTSASHQSMFTMLEHRRFDYAFRSVHEVFDELARLQTTAPNVIVEPSRVFHLFLPTVVFVSPNTPKLAERIERGLVEIYKNGKFFTLFEQFYGDEIAKSNLDQRKVIHLKSPWQGVVKFMDLPGIWYDVEKPISMAVDPINLEN